jgi:AcrR family transcriptional regulator
MESKHATRSTATRAALVAAARPLFAKRGFADVGTEEIVRAAGVTRGALYHQFADKTELYAAVFEDVEREVTERIAQGAFGAGASTPFAALEAGAEQFLAVCAEPEIQRIVLLDAPVVLGWERWREIGMRYGMGLVEGTLRAAIDAGELEEQPTRPLAHVLIGALDEAAMVVARAEDPDATREEMLFVLRRMLGTLRA